MRYETPKVEGVPVNHERYPRVMEDVMFITLSTKFTNAELSSQVRVTVHIA